MKNLLQNGFNTSHVVVYPAHKWFILWYVKFQYISCCSLSFNNLANGYAVHQFQYISCCSLSIFSDIGVPGAPEFQYISCCSLSIFAEQSQIGMVGFNTSHVVVYHQETVNRIPMNSRFNTSHVVVYQSGMPTYQLSPSVSIHLMLQFIRSHFIFIRQSQSFNTSHVVVYRLIGLSPPKVPQFQYISCCSLSSALGT